jgi:hypothetical protein
MHEINPAQTNLLDEIAVSLGGMNNIFPIASGTSILANGTAYTG